LRLDVQRVDQFDVGGMGWILEGLELLGGRLLDEQLQVRVAVQYRLGRLVAAHHGLPAEQHRYGSRITRLRHQRFLKRPQPSRFPASSTP
jgi:hypothetical protein